MFSPYKKKVRFRLYFPCSVSGWVHYPCYSGVSVLPLQKKSQISFILYLQCFWLSSLSMLQWRKCSPPTKKKSVRLYCTCSVSGWVHYPCYSGVSVLPLQKKSQISFILYLQCFWLSSLSMLQWRKCSPPTKKKKVRFRLYFTCSVSGWVHYPCYSGVSVLPLQKKKSDFVYTLLAVFLFEFTIHATVA